VLPSLNVLSANKLDIIQGELVVLTNTQ